MNFGQISLPPDATMEHVKKAFVDASQGLNALGAAAGMIIVTGSKTSFSLPSPAEASGQTITYLHTGTAQVKIQGKASGYSSWTLETPGDLWTFYSDGANWYAIGGQSVVTNSNGTAIKYGDGSATQYLWGYIKGDGSNGTLAKTATLPFAPVAIRAMSISDNGQKTTVPSGVSDTGLGLLDRSEKWMIYTHSATLASVIAQLNMNSGITTNASYYYAFSAVVDCVWK